MKLSTSGGLMGQQQQQAHEGVGEKKCLNSELWHACAGPLVSLPTMGSRVVYFAQGHSEQVSATTNKEIDGQIPNYPSLPPQLICQLHNVTMHADVETDEVYAQMTIQPLTSQEQKDTFLPVELGIPSKQPTNYFYVDRLTYSALPRDCGVGEGSWAGLSFSPSQWSMAAMARNFCKSIDVYDQDIHLRTVRTLLYPTSLSFIQNPSHGSESSIVAVTEGCQLTIWDLRMKENGGCVQRICGSIGDMFYAVCSSSTGNIAVGGADRTVTIYDPRRWSTLSRWVHCSKYEITQLAFSSIHPDYIYIQGVDYEVFCGQWKRIEKVFSFRGDSNWLGQMVRHLLLVLFLQCHGLLCLMIFSSHNRLQHAISPLKAQS